MQHARLQTRVRARARSPQARALARTLLPQGRSSWGRLLVMYSALKRSGFCAGFGAFLKRGSDTRWSSQPTARRIRASDASQGLRAPAIA